MLTKDRQTVIIALGGSIIVPGQIQIKFLKRFKKFVLRFLKQTGLRFVIVAGGGAVSRNYIRAVSDMARVSNEDKDWIGIHATRINAHLLRTIFAKDAYPTVLDNPLKPVDAKNYNLFIASGWRPGWSTDYDAVLLAERFKVDRVIIASNIDYVYEKDIARYKNARPIKQMTWTKYRRLIGGEWKPGMKAPVDPVAAGLASKLKMTAIVTRGTNLRNLENILRGKKFKGTIIHP